MKLHEFNNEKSILIIGGTHGDEHTGVSIAKAFLPMQSSNFNIIPCLNIQGYRNDTRDLNGIDLNRSYMNPTEGPTPDECWLIKQLSHRADLVIDIHATPETMMNKPCCLVQSNSEQYGSLMNVELINKEAPQGSLRNYCVHNGIPMITYEAVERRPCDQREVEKGIDGILNILEQLRLN